ncbi:MAG: hypothetical protein IVW57_08505 [Ktedonobacterales bacterium]|nr:hypothetical protein [Ktedonobacterales bacterium]
MITQIVPLLIIVSFWGLIFIFAFWFTNRALRAPQAADHEESQEHAPLTMEDQVPTRSGH